MWKKDTLPQIEYLTNKYGKMMGSKNHHFVVIIIIISEA